MVRYRLTSSRLPPAVWMPIFGWGAGTRTAWRSEGQCEIAEVLHGGL